jgi:hypothetical protein
VRSATFAAAALAIVVAAGGGCELAIGDGVPAFACNPGPDTCPDNQVCDPERHQCVAFCTPTSCPGSMQCDVVAHLCRTDDASVPDASADNVTDAPGEHDGSVPLGDTGSADDTAPPDAPTETSPGDTGPCTGLLCKCTGPAACDSHICADQLTIGTGLFMAAGSASFCTKPCCTSADCDPSTVCYATGVGGNYCVLPAWLQRSTTLGTSIGGQTCSDNTSCRSGLCASSTCADTCCSTPSSATECGAGTTCSFGTFPGAPMDASTGMFDQNYTAYCSGPGGTGTNGSPCNFSSDCASNRCDTRARICRDACRNTSACTGGGFSCEYRLDPMTNSVFATCQSSNGMTPIGGACMQDGDCQTGFCNPTVMLCTDVCFGDSDCSAVTGWRCRPQQLALQGGGSAAVLCCGL